MPTYATLCNAAKKFIQQELAASALSGMYRGASVNERDPSRATRTAVDLLQRVRRPGRGALPRAVRRATRRLWRGQVRAIPEGRVRAASCK